MKSFTLTLLAVAIALVSAVPHTKHARAPRTHKPKPHRTVRPHQPAHTHTMTQTAQATVSVTTASTSTPVTTAPITTFATSTTLIVTATTEAVVTATTTTEAVVVATTMTAVPLTTASTSEIAAFTILPIKATITEVAPIGLPTFLPEPVLTTIMADPITSTQIVQASVIVTLSTSAGEAVLTTEVPEAQSTTILDISVPTLTIEGIVDSSAQPTEVAQDIFITAPTAKNNWLAGAYYSVTYYTNNAEYNLISAELCSAATLTCEYLGTATAGKGYIAGGLSPLPANVDAGTYYIVLFGSKKNGEQFLVTGEDFKIVQA